MYVNVEHVKGGFVSCAAVGLRNWNRKNKMPAVIESGSLLVGDYQVLRFSGGEVTLLKDGSLLVTKLLLNMRRMMRHFRTPGMLSIFIIDNVKQYLILSS